MFSAVKLSLNLMTPPERRRYWALLTARAVSGLLDVFGVLLVGLMGAIAASAITGSLPNIEFLNQLGLGWIINASNLLYIAAVTLLFFAVKAAVSMDVIRRQTKVLAQVETRVSTNVVQSLLAGSRAESEKWSQSELNYGLTTAINAAFGRLLSLYSTVLSEGFLLLCIAVILFFVSPVTMVFVIVYFGALGFAIHLFVGRKHGHFGVILAESTVGTITTLTESLTAFREIFALGRQDFFVDRFRRFRGATAASAGALQLYQALPRYIVELALMIGAVGLIAAQSASGNFAEAAATLGIFLTAGMRIIGSLLPLQGAAGTIRQVAAESLLAHRLFEDFPTVPPDVTEITSASVQVEPGPLGVEAARVSYRYEGASYSSLDSVSFSISPGQFCAVIGPSGAGKSTLADVLLGILRPTAGVVKVGSQNIAASEHLKSGLVAYVPQRPGLVSGSIAENVALGREADDIDLDRVENVLKLANMWQYIEGLPEGIHSSVGKQSGSLSGGQIQRLGLARALYGYPKLLILDEATSALDAESESIVGETLRQLHGELTLIVIAHRLSTVQHADNVIVLESGQVLASGTFAFLRENVPLVQKYIELMALEE